MYGERQAAHAFYTTVITNFIKRLLSKQPPVIDGEGKRSMDFTHVNDVVQANIKAMESSAANEVFNVGTGVSTTVRDLAQILIDVLEVDVEPMFNGQRSLVSQPRADTRKAKELLGFEAEVGVVDGLTQFARAVVASPDKY